MPLMMKNYICLAACFLCAQFALGQKTDFTFKEIDSIVNRIDASGKMYGSARFEFGKKKYGTKPVAIERYLKDASREKLLKVIRQTFVEPECNDTFYFHNDSLICLKISGEFYIKKKKKINCRGRYYFQNGILIFKQDDPECIFNPEEYLTRARQFLNPGYMYRKQ